MLRVAIVGLGGIGNTHARVYQANPKCKIVAVCDILKDRADKAAAAYGCPAFYSVKEMLADGMQIDAASMCTAGKENGVFSPCPADKVVRRVTFVPSAVS